MSSLFHYTTDVGPITTGHEFNQTAWAQLNRLYTGTEQFGFLMLKWGLTTVACDCGAEQQAPDHIH